MVLPPSPLLPFPRRAAGLAAAWFLLAPGGTAEGAEGSEDGDSGAPGIARAADETVDVVAEAEEGAAPDPADTSGAVTVVRADDPTLPPGADLADALSAAPGVHVRRLGGLGDYTTATIRGSTARQVEVFLDGVPLNPDGLGVVNLAELPLSGLERVEVWRGGAPAWLGSAAMGGVVNLVTPTGDHPPTRIEGAFGQYVTRRVHASGGTDLGRGADLRLSVDSFGTRGDFTYFDDRATPYNLFDDRTLVRENNDKQDLSVLARVRGGSDRLSLTFQDGFYARDEGIPGNAHDPALSAHLSTVRNLAHVALGVPLPRAGRVDARLYHQYRREHYGDPWGEVGWGSYDQVYRYHDLGGTGRLRLVPLPFLAADVSAALRVDTYQPYSLLEDPPTDGTRWRGTGRLSGEASLSLWGDRLRISAVLEGRIVDDRFLGEVPYSTLRVNEGAEPVRFPFTPRVGVRFRPVPALTLKANAGRYVRLPDFVEIYGNRGALIGNYDLRPESGTALDAGARIEGAVGKTRAAAEVVVFHTASEDLIAYVTNAQRQAMPINLGAARVSGVEAGVQATVLGLLHLGADVTWADSRNASPDDAYSGNRIPHLPEWEVQARVALVWPFLRLGWNVSHTAGTFEDATNWYLEPPRTVHGAHIRVQPGPRWPFLALEVRNLTDERVAVVPANPLDPTSDARAVKALTDFTGYPTPGRTFLATLGLTLPGPSPHPRPAVPPRGAKE